VEEIEELAFPFAPWDLDEIHSAAHASDPRYRCLIARSEMGYAEEVLGWAFYRVDDLSISILRIATHPSSWLRGIGRLMVDEITRTGAQDSREITFVALTPGQLGSLAFFLRVGFKRTGFIYEDRRRKDVLSRYSQK
jgi:GNAT superfamily N-acetyltransferase